MNRETAYTNIKVPWFVLPFLSQYVREGEGTGGERKMRICTLDYLVFRANTCISDLQGEKKWKGCFL